MAARNDFHWLRFLLISVYHIWQFALRRSLIILQCQFIAKAMGSKDLWSLVLFQILLSFPVLIVTCAVCSFRAQIYKHIGSEGIQNHVEFPFPVSLKLLLFCSLFLLSVPLRFSYPSCLMGMVFWLCAWVCVWCVFFVFCSRVCVSV